ALHDDLRGVRTGRESDDLADDVVRLRRGVVVDVRKLHDSVDEQVGLALVRTADRVPVETRSVECINRGGGRRPVGSVTDTLRTGITDVGPRRRGRLRLL